jgi:hypothetical protein
MVCLKLTQDVSTAFRFFYLFPKVKISRSPGSENHGEENRSFPELNLALEALGVVP